MREELDREWLDEDRFFHRVPRRKGCAYCTGELSPASLRPAVEGVYCISVREESFRTEQASELFHRVGLCRDVVFYRPYRGRQFSHAVWTSHRAVARRALETGQSRVLVFEDDVGLPDDWPARTRTVVDAIQSLPEGWWGFFLGHFPIQAYFVNRHVTRARTLLAQAYVANAPLLRWLAATEPLDPLMPRWRSLCLDHAFMNLPEMYAFYPMIASQRFMGEYRVDPRFTSRGERRKLTDPERLKVEVAFRRARWAELVAVALSPLHRLTLERFRARSGTRLAEDAGLILASGLFDEAFYLDRNPDVAASGMPALAHYLQFGAREGRNPHPLFDAAFYAAQSWQVARNPLAHYLRRGAGRGRDPHPLFDTSWYVERYRDRLGALNPLQHFVERGAFEGCDPSPGFSCRAYLAEHPELVGSRINPLVHHVLAASDQPASPG